MGNFCCVDFQTNCKKSITIGYLKALVEGIVPINTGASHNFADDNYCPTYSELTSGILIAQYVDGGTDHWGDNVDGIKVEGTYSASSVVNKEDVIFSYTMFGSVNLMADETVIAACGGSTYLTVTCGLTKVTKRINTDCEIITTTSSGSDTGLTKTYHSSENWLTFSGRIAEADKNGTVSSSTRTTNVICTVENRGETYSSNTVTISQNGLTGNYETVGTDNVDSFTVVPNTTSAFGCAGGEFSITSTAVIRTRKKWVDECGVKYDNVYKDSTRTENLGTEKRTFPSVECPVEEYSTTSTLTKTFSGITSSITFTQICVQECCSATGYICTPACDSPIINVNKCGESGTTPVTVTSYCLEPEDLEHQDPYNDYVVTWAHDSATDDFVTFGGNKNLTWTAKKNCSSASREAKYTRYIKNANQTVTIQQCVYTFRQTAERCETCECDCDVLSFDKALDYYSTNEIGRDGGTFEYTYSFASCSGDKNVTFSKGNTEDTWYSLNNNTANSKLTVTINPRTTASAATASINVLVNGDSCVDVITFKQQEGCQCSDASQTINTTIPRTGLTVGETVGTYTIGNGCDNKISFTSSDLSITTVNGEINLTSAIPANNDDNEKTFHIVKKLSGVECETYTLTQTGLACSCGNLHVTLNPTPQTGVSANSIIGTYTIDAECVIKTTLTSTDLSITYSGGNIITTNAIPANDGENSITYAISGKVGTYNCGPFTTTQPGLACDCAGMTTSFSIPQTGLSANSQIGTYSFENSDCLNKATFTSNDLSISYSNGVIRTTNAIPANTDEDPKTYTINSKVRTTNCTPIVVSQAGLSNCTCSNFRFTISNVNVPCSGITASSIIGTWTRTGTCSGLPSFTCNLGGVNLSAQSGGNITLNNAIPANYSTSSRSITITMYGNGSQCASSALTQAACCDCNAISSNPNDFYISDSIYETGITYNTSDPFDSDNYIGNCEWNIEPCSGTARFVLSSSTNVTQQLINNPYAPYELYITEDIPGNDGSSPISYVALVYVNNVLCSMRSNIATQNVMFTCDCECFKTLATTNIPATGGAYGRPIIRKISPTSDCFNACDPEKLEGYVIATNTSTPLETSFIDFVGYQQGSWLWGLSSAIPNNSLAYPLWWRLRLEYDGEECETIMITQNGANVDCDCEDFDQFITRNRTTLPRASQNNYLIFSADTYGCGYFEANVSEGSSMFQNGEIIETSIDGHIQTFTANITNTYSDRSAGIVISYYKYEDANQGSSDCTHTIHLWQLDDYVNCNKPMYTYADGVVHEYETFNVPSCTHYYKNYSGNYINVTQPVFGRYSKSVTSITTDDTWATNFYISNSGSYYNTWSFTLGHNTITSDRTCNLTITQEYDETNYEGTTGTCSITVPLTQYGKVTTCSALKQRMKTFYNSRTSTNVTYDSSEDIFVFDKASLGSNVVYIFSDVYLPAGGKLILESNSYYTLTSYSNNDNNCYGVKSISLNPLSGIVNTTLYFDIETCDGLICRIFKINIDLADPCDCNIYDTNGGLFYNNEIVKTHQHITYISFTCSTLSISNAIQCDVNGNPTTYNWFEIDGYSGGSVWGNYLIDQPDGTIGYIKVTYGTCSKVVSISTHECQNSFSNFKSNITITSSASTASYGQIGTQLVTGTFKIPKQISSYGESYDSKCVTQNNVVCNSTHYNALRGSVVYNSEDSTYYYFDCVAEFIANNPGGSPTIDVTCDNTILYTTTFT